MSGSVLKKTRNRDVIGLLEFNQYALARKITDAGLPVPYESGSIATIVATEVRVGPRTPILIVNATGATIFIAVGDTGVTAPTNFTNGLAILNNTSLVVNTGDKEYIIFNTTSASAQYCLLQDDGKHEK
jgi:hypothetical protein